MVTSTKNALRPNVRHLKLGSHGAPVRKLEEGLKKQGLLKGAVDGKFDKKTEAAVAKYERANGIEVNGIVGGRIWKALHLGQTGQQSETKGGPTDLVISSFNITGSSHTKPGAERPEFETGVKRMKYVVQKIKQHKVDVVGFQELQGDQLQAFNKLTDNKFGVYPGFKLGKRESVNSVAWDKKKWDLVKADSVKIPYFNGSKRDMPVVLLQNRETGQKAYFTNFHNPADTKRFHKQEKYRDAAEKIEVALVNRLEKSGHPVFLTGDMNESTDFQRRMAQGTNLHSANQGEKGRDARPAIDWIYGSKDVNFSEFERDRSRLVRKTTNHPMVVAHARIRAEKKG